jgi:hypothetical protein
LRHYAFIHHLDFTPVLRTHVWAVIVRLSSTKYRMVQIERTAVIPKYCTAEEMAEDTVAMLNCEDGHPKRPECREDT